MKSIVFTGGGSGGHIYPGLAIAKRLQSVYKCRIIWIGSKSKLDKDIVQDAGLEFYAIPSGKLRRYFSIQNFIDIFKIAAGFINALIFLKKNKPMLVFSKGGFVSVPPCAAAALLKIPVFTHESDFSPGLATKLNLRFAEKLFCAYEPTLGFIPEKYRSKAIVSGNPVRDAFRTADPDRGRNFLGVEPQKKILLVLGGSLGAKQVNDLVRSCLDELCEFYTVIHQTGTKDENPEIRHKNYMAYSYIGAEMPDILAAADLVVGRSGAGTVWEAAVCAKPMILIPLSGSATRGDQVENAEFFRQAGAALVLDGTDPDKDHLMMLIQELHNKPESLQAMAAAAAVIGNMDAVSSIVQSILERVKGAY